MFYALAVGLLVHRELKLGNVIDVVKKSVISSAVIMFIIANAGLFAFLITPAGIPDAIGVWLTEVLKSPAAAMARADVPAAPCSRRVCSVALMIRCLVSSLTRPALQPTTRLP